MLKLQISLLSIFLTPLLSGTAVSPMLPAMAENFVDVNFSKLFLTIPSLIIIPFLFFSGFLEHFISRKNLILSGLYLYVISGIGCIFAPSTTLLLVFRSLSGIGAGLVVPYSASLISDYFKGEQRDKILGYSGVMVYSSGIFVLLITGFLVSIYWRLGFLISLVALIPLFLIKYNIPKVTHQFTHKKFPWIFRFIFKKIIYKVAILNFFAILLMYTYFISISFLIRETDLGSSKESSIAQSFFMLAGVISNLLMNTIKRASSTLLHALQMFFNCLGFLMLGIYNDGIHYIYIGSFLIGIGYGSFSNSIVSLISNNTTIINRVNALAFVISTLYLAQFLSPFFISGIMYIFNTASYKVVFLIVGGIFTIVSLLLFATFTKENKKIIISMKELRTMKRNSNK